MKKFEQILTREQLEHEIYKILLDGLYIHDEIDGFETIVGRSECATKICDLIADLPNLCFHSKNESI